MWWSSFTTYPRIPVHRGVPRNDFVRFSIDHIAYAMPVELRELLLKFINKTIQPVCPGPRTGLGDSHRRTHPGTVDHSGDASADSGSEEEKRWIRDNKPSKPTPAPRRRTRPKSLMWNHTSRSQPSWWAVWGIDHVSTGVGLRAVGDCP